MRRKRLLIYSDVVGWPSCVINTATAAASSSVDSRMCIRLQPPVMNSCLCPEHDTDDVDCQHDRDQEQPALPPADQLALGGQIGLEVHPHVPAGAMTPAAIRYRAPLDRVAMACDFVLSPCGVPTAPAPLH